MPVLPRYQKTGIKVRQPSGMDFADAREAARMGETLSAELDRMSDFAFREGEKLAVRRGQERVRQEGAVPVLTALQQKEGPRTIAEQAAFDAANRIAVVEIETAARSDMRKLVTEADETNMEISVFNQKMSDIQDGYAASMQVVDPVAAGVLNARLQEDNVAYSTKYSEIVTTKAKAAYAENTQTILDEGVQTIRDFALTEGATKEAIRKKGEELLQTALDRGVGDKKANKLVDAAVNDAIEQNLYYKYENAEGILEKQAIVNELSEIEVFPGKDYVGTITLKDRFINDLDRQINAGRSQFTTELDDAITFLVSTGKIKPGFEVDEDKLTELFFDDQETLDALLRQWENAQEDVKRYGSLSSMPISKINEVLSKLKNDAENPPKGATGAEAELLKTRYNNFNTAVIQRQEALRSDPALYVTQTNKQAEQLTSTFFKALGEGNIGLAATVLSGLNETLNIQYDAIGVPQSDRRLLSKDVAQQMIQSIQAIDDDAEIAIIKEIQTSLGDLAPRFADELRKNGLAPEYVEALFTDDPGLHLELVQLSQSKEADLEPKGEGIAANAEKILLAEVDDYRIAYLSGGDSAALKQYNQQYNVAKKLMYKYMTVNGMDGQAAAERVRNEIFPEYNNVVNTPSGQFIVPIEFNGQTIEILSNQLLTFNKLTELNIKELDMTDYPKDVSEVISLQSLATRGVWLNNSTGDGIVLHFRTNTDRLLPAKYNDGRVFDLKFKDLLRMQEAPSFAPSLPEDPVVDIYGGAETFMSPEYKEQAQKAFGIEDTKLETKEFDPKSFLRTIDLNASRKDQNAYRKYIIDEFEKNNNEPLTYPQWFKTQ
tara:strand:- start:10249 stop:12738 length:2490 start_codon:yes stop_codon:yes gene_type:complete